MATTNKGISVSTASAGEQSGEGPYREAPPSPMAPLDEKLGSAEDEAAFGRIRERGLKVSTSNLEELNLVASGSSALRLGVRSPVSPPLSPALPTPRGMDGQAPRRRSFHASAAATAAKEQNPCFPRGSRSSMTAGQREALNQALAAARPVPHHPNANLTHAGDWLEIVKTLGATIDETVPLLLRRSTLLDHGLHSSAARKEDVERFTQIAREAFGNVSNALYVVQREHQKLAFKGGRTRHLKWPSGESRLTETEEAVQVLHYMIGQLPLRFAEFSERLDEMDSRNENYDTTLDKRRLRKAEAYIREAARLLA